MSKEIICGIYKIESPSNKIYIGQSNDCLCRIRSYKNLKCKEQPRLFYSLLKYGWEAHIFEIIHKCEESELNALERHYIYLYQTFNTKNGLNLRDGGGSSGKLSQESKEKIRRSQLGKKHTPETKIKQSFNT